MVRFDWFTHAVLEDGIQLIAIRPAAAADATTTVVLGRSTSTLVNSVLNALANEPTLDWPAARQACLRAVYETSGGRPAALIGWLREHYSHENV